MFTTFIGLIDIQSWWEVPCIAHFCSLFSTTFELPVFDIEDLEEALLTDTDAEGQVEPKVYIARLLPDLIVALLKGCDTLAPVVAHISPSNYQMFLRRLFRQKCQEHRVENPFNTDTDFEKLPLRTKILILKYLCEFRLDSDDVSSFALYEPNSIRLEPLGYDRNGSSYWHFFGTRLYREDYVHGKHKSGSTKPTVWQVICFSEEDWRNLAHKFENSTDRKERALHALLVENFLPYIPKLFRDKERVRRVKLLERKTSSRLRLKREERILRQQQQVQQPIRESEQPGPSEVPEEENPSRGQQLAEARAKRAERRSRSNSVTSIVTTHASSSEPRLTPDFIFQPKENAFRKEISTYPYLHTTNLRGSTSPSVGSHLLKQGEEEEDHLQDTISGSNSGPARETNRSPSCVSRESIDSASSYRHSTDSSSTFVSGEGTVHVQSLSDSFFIANRHDSDDDSESLDNVEAENNINTNNTINHWRTAAESLIEIKAPHADKAQPIDSNKKQQHQVRRVCSTELESLLRLNHNMAPTATKLPGRQTNNSLSSVTGPVILPFADGGMQQKGSSAGSSNLNNNNSNGSTPGNGKSGIESATNNGGRKGKKGAKSAQHVFTKTTSSAFISSSLSFTETDEVLQIGMHKVLESIKNHDDAWPFMDPVDEDIAPRYYSIIRRPMDLQKMEEKLDNGEYAMFGDFQYDFKLIVNNCRLYNGQANEYTEMVNNLQLAFERARKKYFDENSSDEEMMTLEHPPDVSRSSAVKEKVSSSQPNKSGDTSSGGGKPSSKEAGSNAAGSGTKADNTVKEKTKKSGSAVNVKGGSGASGSVATDVDRGPLNSGESKKQTPTDKAKDNKPKPVKGAPVATASSDQKEGKHGPATKKPKPIKHPEMAADPKPAPEPLENETSGSSGSKNLKRKRKEKEKANSKVKNRKVKTETSDDRRGDVVMKEEVDVRAVENKEDDDWGGPERKRVKKERTEYVTKKVQSKSVSAADERHVVVYQDHKDHLVPVRSEQSKIEGVKRSPKHEEQEDYPVYESKKKAAIKALQRQEKEKKKYSAKVKKEDKKTKTTVSSNSLSGTGKYGKGKHETRSPVRRSLSRTPSPAPLPKLSRLGVESPVLPTDSNFPPLVSRLEKDSTNDKSKAHKLAAKKTNDRNDTEYEETQKRDESKPKKSVTQTKSGPAGGKGLQKKDTRNKRKEGGVAKPEKKCGNEPVVDEKKIAESNSDSSGTHADDGSDCEQDSFSRQRQNAGANEEELSEDGNREGGGRSKKSDKSKNKKSKNNKNSIENNNDVEDHHHHRGSKKGRGSKVKGKEKKIDKKSHKKDKAGRGRKKSKPTSSYCRDPSVSSGGEDDDRKDDVETTTDGSSSRRQQATAEEHSKSASNCAKQTRDFTLYSIHSHDGLSRSASRSPSPIGSYFSDQSEDNDDEMDDSKTPKGSLDRPITPDIKDKFDLIKERRNRAAAAAAVAAAAKAKAKQTKVKTKAKETATGTSPGKRSKQKTPNRGQQEQQLDVVVTVSITASASGSKHPKKRHQQQHQQDQENEKPAVEMAKQKNSPSGSAKGKKKRDKSIEQPTAHGMLDTSSSWNKAHEKKRPTDAKKVDRSIEYEFVDEGAYDPVSHSTVSGKPDTDRRTSHTSAGVKSKAAHKRPLAAGPVSVSQKHGKTNTKPTAAMITKTSGGVTSASKGAMVPPAAPGAGGANMEELELETEQTLKDINKWLENTPRFPEYSSASNSPSRYIMDDFDSVPVKIEDTDFRKPIPLSQLPASATTAVSESSEKRSSGPAASPLRGSSPALAAMAAPPTAFSPKSSTSGASAKPGSERASQQHSSGATETSLKDTTNSAKDSTTSNMKSAGSTNHTILGPPPIIPAHSQKKEAKEPKRKTLKEKLSQLGARKRDLHRTIDRLQPGKTKGNLIGTMQNLNKPDDLFAIGGGSGGNGGAGGGTGANGSAGSGSSGALGKFKEVKNSLIVKTDESKPKLSLGTVLNTEGFGIVQQHNFADDVKDDVEAEDFETRRSELRKAEEEATTVDEPATKASSMFKLSNGSANSDLGTQKTTSTTGKTEDGNNATGSTPGDKEQSAGKPGSAVDEGSRFTKDDTAKKENGATKPTAGATLPAAEGKEGSSVPKGADKPSATPNLSAWFKAFGVPKKPKKSEDSDEPGKASPASDKSKGADQTPPTASESSLAPTGVPGGLEGSSYPSLPAPPRQRKASTGSTVSERSSYSQDPDSPRIGIDERIGGYPGPYPSPIGASPIMTSPKLDESQKSPYHPLNGAIKVGFYQDTTQKSSPEKSCSPRDMPSSYPQYSQHLYTANTATSGNTATNSGSLYGNYANYGGISGGTSGPSTSSAITGSTSTAIEEATRRQNNNNSVSGAPASTESSGGTTTPAADSFKGYGKELKSPVDFYDQYKQPASQESDYNSSMSPSTNPNSPYHNPASSPYHQQPNSPACYQQQQPNQASSPYNNQQQQQQHQQSLASPASSGPLSPYSTSSVTPNPPTVPHSPTGQTGLGGHSPYNNNNSAQAHSPYHGGAANNNQAPPPPPQSASAGAGGPKSKPNTPLHQSPNSPFSQSNQSSPYSQQDPNSPYSQGQLSPFQPMSPKPSQPTVATSASGAGQSSIKLAPPIITPQQAAAAAGVILPVEAVAQNLATPTSGGSSATSATPPQINPHHQQHHHQSAASSSHWSHQGHYNPYLSTGSGDPGSSGSSGSSSSNSAMLMPPAPAHMPNATSSQAQQQPQQAHHNAHQHPSPAHAHQQHHDQQQQPHPYHTQQHQHPPLQNHHQRQPHHALATAAGQQQHSHLSNLLMGANSNPYASSYGRPYDLNSASAAPATLEHQHPAHHHQQQHPHHPQHQHQQQHQQHSSKVPEMINLGYSEPEATGGNSNATPASIPKQQQDVPMNMETTGGGAITLSGKSKHPDGKEGGASKQPLAQQQHPQQAYDYAGAMDASISGKSKSFDVFNRSAPMNYPRGFGTNHGAAAPPINSGAGGAGSGVVSSPVGYDHHGNNINKAHEQHGAPNSYNMQTSGTTTAPSALASAKGASGSAPSELMLSRYDQRSPQQLHIHPQQQQQQQQSANNMDLSSSSAAHSVAGSITTGGYKPYSSAISGPTANLMDPSIRNLASLSSLYNPDDRLLGPAPGAGPALPTATAGYYDKSIPPTAHMYSKNLAPPTASSSAAAAVAAATAATTSTLQQMFNSTMAATSSMAYGRGGEPQNAAYVPGGYHHHQSQQQNPAQQQQQPMNTSQKMIHGSGGGVPSSDCNPGSGDPQPPSVVAPPPAKPKRTRKKKDPNQDLLAQQQQQQHQPPSLHQQQPNQQLHQQGFQSYSGLKPPANPVSVASPSIGQMVTGGTGGTGMGGSHPTGSAESSAISLKTTNVPGSAFNFGTGPSGLGLPGSLYGDTSVASAAYLDDAYRNTQNSYYLAPPGHRGPPVVDEKLASVVNAAGTSQGVAPPPPPGTVAVAAAAAAASAAAAAASVVHPPPPSAASSYHQYLASHHGSRTYQFMNQLDPLHPQYFQRHPDELRAQMMLNQGLLGPPGPAPPSAYAQASYHPALGMHKPYDAMNSMNRPPFL